MPRTPKRPDQLRDGAPVQVGDTDETEAQTLAERERRAQEYWNRRMDFYASQVQSLQREIDALDGKRVEQWHSRIELQRRADAYHDEAIQLKKELENSSARLDEARRFILDHAITGKDNPTAWVQQLYKILTPDEAGKHVGMGKADAKSSS